MWLLFCPFEVPTVYIHPETSCSLCYGYYTQKYHFVFCRRGLFVADVLDRHLTILMNSKLLLWAIKYADFRSLIPNQRQTNSLYSPLCVKSHILLLTF